jgi:hypothetical protein
MGKGLNRDEHKLLRELVSRRDDSALPLIDSLLERRLTQDEREILRGLVADELVEQGLDEHDEPTAYGLQMERLIDALGHQ